MTTGGHKGRPYGGGLRLLSLNFPDLDRRSLPPISYAMLTVKA
jgi:hypothetical protein